MYNAPVLMSGDANSYAEMRLFRGTTELRIFTDLGCYNGAAQVATQTFITIILIVRLVRAA